MLVCTFSEFAKTFFEGYAAGLLSLPVGILVWTVVYPRKSTWKH